MNRVVFAYSGSAEGTVCIHWLQHQRNMQVATFTANLGQGGYLEPTGELAMDVGVESAHVGDLRGRFVHDYVIPTLKANAEAAIGRPLSSALARPLIATEIVKIAVEDSRGYVGHGGKPMSADQTQFQGSVASLAPQLKVMAPLREWGMKSRDDVLAYAARYGIDINPKMLLPYSLDRNLWGLRIQGPELDDLWTAPAESVFQLTCSPLDAPAKPEDVMIGFEAGVPVSLDGEAVDLLTMIGKLNDLAGKHAIGRYDIVENRMTGVRARRLYEAPAATLLYSAHIALENIVLSRELLYCKADLSRQFAGLIYSGQWFSDLRKALSAFFDQTQVHVTGEVNLRLYKGGHTVLGRRSPCSMYDCERDAPEVDVLDGAAMGGYAKIMSLPLKTEARRAAREL